MAFNRDMALSDEDLKNIKNLLEVTIDEATVDKIATKEDLKHLPTKDEFYKRTGGHEDRITTLEKTVELHPSP